MPKQLNVSLGFNVSADTKEANRRIQDLMNSLSKIANQSIKVDDKDLQDAAESAKQLTLHLNNAFNANTGRFDLSKLDKSLKTSKMNVTDLSTQLLKAGTVGE
jgi:uncharacterized protein YacL